jgi:hypothetical protein
MVLVKLANSLHITGCVPSQLLIRCLMLHSKSSSTEASRTKVLSRCYNISFDNRRTKLKQDLYAFQFFTEILLHYLCSTWGCSVLQQCSRCHPKALAQGLNYEHTWFVVLWTVWVFHFWRKLGLEGTSLIFIHRLQE